MRGLLIGALLVLTGCAAPESTRRIAEPPVALPPMNTFVRATPTAPIGRNSAIARDFLDLAFALENGAELATFTRFEGPITVRVSGRAPVSLSNDLDKLLVRLRSEANLNISRISDGDPSIMIVPVTRAQIRRVAPTAACFVRPNVSSWDEYRKRRSDPETFWTNLQSRDRMAVFLPSDVSPQEMRDCLHEEVAQALGPVNDLYRLSQSVFNDDNFHTVLTGYDMLILRAYYDPALAQGMTRDQVAARLPAILNRINPRGASRGIAAPRDSSREWKQAVTAATQPRAPRDRRRAAAERAVSLAQNNMQAGYAHYIYGRLLLTSDPDAALSSFKRAAQLFERKRETRLHAAHVAMQISAFHLSAGDANGALRLVDKHIDVVKRAEYATLLSLLLLVKAEALALLDRDAESAELQAEALAWARYGFGSESEVRARAAEILAISPRSRETAT